MAFHKRRPIFLDETQSYFVGESLKSEITLGSQNQMNYLRNWYYPPLAYYVGTNDTDHNPIATAANSYGRFYIQTCYPNDDQPIMMVFKPGSRSGTDSAVIEWWPDWSIDGGFTGTHYDNTGTTMSPYVFLDDQRFNPQKPIELLVRGPSTGDGTIRVGCLRYKFLACASFCAAKGPQRWLTNSQAKVLAGQVGKNDFIRGYTGSETSNSIGELIYWGGDKSQGNTVDTAENATRRSAQWMHPWGLWGDTTDYSSLTCIFGDPPAPGPTPASRGTLTFFPRNIYGESLQKAKVGVVYTTTADLTIQIENLTNNHTLTSSTLSGTLGAAALVTFDNLYIDATQPNEIVVNCSIAAGELSEFIIHSVAVFETDD